MRDNKEFINSWKERIRGGIEYRKKYSTRSRWDDYRKYYRGQWAFGLVPVNKVFSYGKMLIPKVYFRAPRVSVTPTRPDLVWHAKVVEAIDNMLIRETKLKTTIKRAVTDAYLCGVGPIKLGYDSEFGYLPDQAVVGDEETLTQIGRKEGERIEYRINVKPGMPWALRVRPEDIVVPWGSDDPDSLPWIAHYILRPLDDVKEDQKYKNTKDLKGTRMPELKDGDTKPQFRPREDRDKDVLFAELWEVRDLKSGEIYVFCEDTLLLAAKDELQVEGLPWEFLMFNVDPEFFWAIPDVAILEPQQIELNDTRTQVSRHRAIALLKFLYLRGKLKPEELEKILSGEVGPAAAVDDTENINSVITTLQPHVPPDLYREIMAIMNDMRETLGFSINQLGEFSPYHGKTATETMTVAEAFESRVDERRDVVADLLVNIIRKWNQFIFKFWTQEKVIRVTSPEGEPFWVEYTGDQLKGEYFLNVDADSGMPITRPLKYQMAKEMMELFGGDQLIDQILLRQILLDNYAIVDPRAGQLLQQGFGGLPELLSKERQPGPGGLGPGKGSAGGRRGSSPEKPMEFEEFRKKMEGGK